MNVCRTQVRFITDGRGASVHLPLQLEKQVQRLDWREPVQVGIAQLIDDSHARQQMIWEFDKIVAMLGESGARTRAAQAIITEIA